MLSKQCESLYLKNLLKEISGAMFTVELCGCLMIQRTHSQLRHHEAFLLNQIKDWANVLHGIGFNESQSSIFKAQGND